MSDRVTPPPAMDCGERPAPVNMSEYREQGTASTGGESLTTLKFRVCDGHHRRVSFCHAMLPPRAMFYSPGESVLITGAYEAMHVGHRSPHQVWVIAHEQFPRCKQCGSGVIFKLVRRATAPTCGHASTDEDFAGGTSAAYGGNEKRPSE